MEINFQNRDEDKKVEIVEFNLHVSDTNRSIMELFDLAKQSILLHEFFLDTNYPLAGCDGVTFQNLIDDARSRGVTVQGCVGKCTDPTLEFQSFGKRNFLNPLLLTLIKTPKSMIHSNSRIVHQKTILIDEDYLLLGGFAVSPQHQSSPDDLSHTTRKVWRDCSVIVKPTPSMIAYLKNCISVEGFESPPPYPFFNAYSEQTEEEKIASMILQSKRYVYIENQLIIPNQCETILKAICERLQRAEQEELQEELEERKGGRGAEEVQKKTKKFKIFIFSHLNHYSSKINYKSVLIESLLKYMNSRLHNWDERLFVGEFNYNRCSSVNDSSSSNSSYREMCDEQNGDVIHSKLMICDDEIMLVSSSNWENRSLRKNRNVELGIVLEDPSHYPFIRKVMDAIWKENLSLIEPDGRDRKEVVSFLPINSRKNNKVLKVCCTSIPDIELEQEQKQEEQEKERKLPSVTIKNGILNIPESILNNYHSISSSTPHEIFEMCKRQEGICIDLNTKQIKVGLGLKFSHILFNIASKRRLFL